MIFFNPHAKYNIFAHTDVKTMSPGIDLKNAPGYITTTRFANR